MNIDDLEKGKLPFSKIATNKLLSTANRNHTQLIVGLCLFVFFNISCFTIITSFTKSNFLTSIQMSEGFKVVFNQKPYFFLYGLSGICFISFYLLYHSLSPRATFEYRIKRDILFLTGCSSVLYLIALLFPGFQQRFFPAAAYFVIYDILDDLIIVQTWTLINYSIDIRESKRIQNLFLFSGGVAAFISGQFIVRLVPQDNQTVFLILVIISSGISYLIVSHIFSFHRSRILATISSEKVRLKTLFASQRKYRVIKSIIYITILIGVFTLFFKVLFDIQVNTRYPIRPVSVTVSDPQSAEMPDPKTEFIGQYKAFVSLFQVVLQLVFIYFFTRLWMNGRILFAYPLLLIPSLVFIIWVYFTRKPGYEDLLFWGTVFACGINELIRRVIFDSAYQLLMFSIPERLCNALRMYARLLIKPLVIVGVCLFFVTIPAQTSPLPFYCFLLMALLGLMIAVVSRIPGDYVSSLKRSVLRRLPVDRALDSLVSLETNHIIEQYQQAVAGSDDRFGYLYILNIIRRNYSPDLDLILAELLENRYREVRLEATLVVGELGIVKLFGHLESMFGLETDFQLREACLRAVAKWGPSDDSFVHKWMSLDLPIHFRKYLLIAAYRNGSAALREEVVGEVTSLSGSSENDKILAGIWLIGELGLSHLRGEIEGHFDMADAGAIDAILEAVAKLKDLELFTAYLNHIGYDRIKDYEGLNRNLALFGTRALDIISDMIESIIRSESKFQLKRCIRALQFISSQHSVDFLADVFLSFNVPFIREEALNCIAKIKKAEPHFDYSVFLKKLPEEISRCKRYCRYYKVVMSWNPKSLVLIELERNIEHRVWSIFKVLDMFYPDLGMFDAYYRITHTSRQYVKTSHAKAKSIEYLESLIIKDEHPEFLQLLESIVFEEGFLADVAPLSGAPLDVTDVYEDILTHSNHWLEISAILDAPPGMKKRFALILEETKDMIPVMEKIHFLREVPLFRGFSIADMIIMAGISQEIRFEAGQVLFKVGDPGDALYLILEGRVNIVNEREQLLVSLSPPESFGEVALLDKKGRTAKAICVDDCLMLMIPRDDFQEILDDYPALYKNIVYILASWLRKDKTNKKELD